MSSTSCILRITARYVIRPFNEVFISKNPALVLANQMLSNNRGNIQMNKILLRRKSRFWFSKIFLMICLELEVTLLRTHHVHQISRHQNKFIDRRYCYCIILLNSLNFRNLSIRHVHSTSGSASLNSDILSIGDLGIRMTPKIMPKNWPKI